VQKSDSNSSRFSPHSDKLFGADALPVVHMLHTDSCVADGLRRTLEAEHYPVKSHSSFNSFIESYVPGQASCLLTSHGSQDSEGVAILGRLRAAETSLPVIFLTDRPPVSLVRSVMRGGRCDFLPTSPQSDELFETIKKACGRFSRSGEFVNERSDAKKKLALLSTRQRQIMAMIISGHTNKAMAFKLRISQRTVESHRAGVMKKLGTRKFSTMVRLAIIAGWEDSSEGA